MKYLWQTALFTSVHCLAGCSENSTTGSSDLAADLAVGPPADGATMVSPCSLPGSVQMTASGPVTVPGGRATPSLSYLHIPVGFCAHYFGNVGNARQLRFAPGGELFVASPAMATIGGGLNGQAAVIILADDDQDGYADAPITFLSGLPSTQGMLFAGGSFYYQNSTQIMRMPYRAGDRSPSGSATMFANITVYSSSIRWPKTLDVADDGSIYVGNGGDQGENCVVPHPFRGGILKIDGVSLGGIQIAQGLRNPIAVRCSRGHNLCFALEQGQDYTYGLGGREKMIPIHQGDDWGFPCCFTQNLPAVGIPVTDCSQVAAEHVSFGIGETPFDLDFEKGKWPGKWNGRAIVAMHGAAGLWVGARVVAIAMDGTTGLPLPTTDLSGTPGNPVDDFLTGWDDNTKTHGRPAAVAFAADGRLFLANDQNGDIIWIGAI